MNRAQLTQRNQAIRREASVQNTSIAELAGKYNLSQQSIVLILRGYPRSHHKRKENHKEEPPRDLMPFLGMDYVNRRLETLYGSI